MPIPSSETGISAQKNVPILCLDTCAILDILRDPTRRDVRIHEQEASLVLLRAAESGSNLEALIADQVSIEFRDNVQKVEKDADDGLSKLRDQIDKLDKLTTLHGRSGQSKSLERLCSAMSQCSRTLVEGKHSSGSI